MINHTSSKSRHCRTAGSLLRKSQREQANRGTLTERSPIFAGVISRTILLLRSHFLPLLLVVLFLTNVRAQQPKHAKLPLPGYRGYHSRFDKGGEANLRKAGSDPWDYARRLGVADNGSFPIPEELRHVDMLHQSAQAAASCVYACPHNAAFRVDSEELIKLVRRE